jgi:hypothetical protein
MPKSALTRSVSALALAVGLLAATLAAPTAQAADGGERKAALEQTQVVDRAFLASRALTRAQDALAGKGGDATMALRELHLLKDSLSPADRAAANRLAARPRTNRADCSSKIACVHWQTGETTGKWAKLVKSTITKVGKIYREAGFRSPKKDGRKGGNSKTDIYVDNLEPGLYGYCTIDPGTRQPGPGRYDVPAYCVVDNNYKGFPANTPKQNLQVTAAHEFFHAVQFAYDYFEDPWLMEATAAWVEDEVYDKVDDNLQYLKSGQLAKPNVPMDKFGFPSYGHWIFFRYLSETLPKAKGGISTIVLDIWKAADSSKGASKDQFSTQAIASVLAKRGTSFPVEFAKFSAANRRSQQFYSEGAANKYPVAPLADQGALGDGQGGTITAKLNHLTSATFRLTPSAVPSGRGLQLNFDLADTATGSAAVVTTYPTAGAPVVQVVPLNASGIGAYEAAFGSDAVSAVEVTLVNASTRYKKCYRYKTDFACGGGKPVDSPTSANVAVQVVP